MMNAKKSTCFILLALTIGTVFTSCGEDRRIEYAEQTGLDRWIDSLMREEYYWYEDMPSSKKMNYFTEPETFLNSVLSSEDNYSFIEDLTATNYSYGFEYKRYSLSDTTYYAQILYVLPNSPASEAGLGRGSYITKINGDSITTKNYADLDGTDAMGITVATYSDGKLGASETAQLSAARSLNDDPILYHSTFSWDGKSIGYLVYNHFTAGTDDSDATYNNELLSLSKDFSGVSNFILDLRYNNSGTLSPARLLGTILAPSNALGETFCSMMYNNKKDPQTESNTFDATLISSGTNLNLQTIYILVSGTTSGSAELLINSLKPYMNVVVIGATTAGENVGLNSYTNSEYQWKMHLAVCQLLNADGDTYENGITPDYAVTESQDTRSTFLPFGDTKELLLATALSVIDGTYSSSTTTASTHNALKTKEIFSSLKQTAGHGVQLK
ncbi:S41 family peptidase [uncultured Bacteroides sp.]|uniref:S41 family peptidase n=1 Tax=uncultured Bacteroides sp. TaxID=162156 RepID=UPI002AA8CE75|nr:S41 family peptidase [uncultured Bacteroides sp.]